MLEHVWIKFQPGAHFNLMTGREAEVALILAHITNVRIESGWVDVSLTCGDEYRFSVEEAQPLLVRLAGTGSAPGREALDRTIRNPPNPVLRFVGPVGEKGVTTDGASAVTYSEAWRIQETYSGQPHGWIQWKGTNVCCDIHCACGVQSHVDGEYMYAVECPDCGRVYFTNGHIQLIEISDADGRQTLRGT